MMYDLIIPSLPTTLTGCRLSEKSALKLRPSLNRRIGSHLRPVGLELQTDRTTATDRFLSPDPYVQMTDFTQNFNRYSYCLNNPLKYNDKNGELFLFTLLNAAKDFLVNSFVKVWSQGFNAWSNGSNWHSTTMAYKIDMGLFKGNVKQIVSRFTWELPQTTLGHLSGSIQNTFYGVRSVSYYDGATAVEYYKSKWGAFTLGSFVNGQRGLYADPNNSLFQHEYGHYLQSQSAGPFYMQRDAIPSFVDAMGSSDHNLFSVEQDANRRAFLYFNKNVEGFYQTEEQYWSNKMLGIEKGWNFGSNPLDIYHTAAQGKYYDYYNPEHRVLIDNLSLHAKWYDYISWLGGVPGAVGVGI